MVNLATGRSNATVLGVTDELARQFGAAVIGVAARQPMQVIYNDSLLCLARSRPSGPRRDRPGDAGRRNGVPQQDPWQ